MFKHIIIGFLTVALTAGQEMQEVDPTSPHIMELGQFTARQMSNKNGDYKLVDVSRAEVSEFASLYKIKVSLQRNGNKKDMLFCTAEIIRDQSGSLSMDQIGCVLPAIVRRRPVAVTEAPITVTEAPIAVTEAPIVQNKQDDILGYNNKPRDFLPVSNQIEEDASFNDIDSDIPVRKPKRHIAFGAQRQLIRTIMPARQVYYRPYVSQYQPIVYRISPQRYFQRY